MFRMSCPDAADQGHGVLLATSMGVLRPLLTPVPECHDDVTGSLDGDGPGCCSWLSVWWAG
jgi:hypothetical protein